MKGVVYLGDSEVEVREFPQPEPGPGQIVIESKVAGLCGSDLHMVNTGWAMHTFPAMAGHPGHEAVGHVVESRSDRFSEGDIVLTTPHIWNSRCFADYQAIDDDHVLKLSPNVDLDTITLAQQLGTVLYAAKRLPASLEGQSCLVVGQGSAGLFWDFTLSILGAETIPQRISLMLPWP